MLRLREEVVKRIRASQQLESDLDLMDIKIGLLVKNRITLQVGSAAPAPWLPRRGWAEIRACHGRPVLVPGGGFPLQEADQEEQGAALGDDVPGQAEGAQGAQQGEAAEAGGVPAPLLPAAGEAGDAQTCPARREDPNPTLLGLIGVLPVPPRRPSPGTWPG